MYIREEKTRRPENFYPATAVALLALCAAPWMGPVTVTMITNEWVDDGFIVMHPTQSLFSTIDFLPQILGWDSIAMIGMGQLIVTLAVLSAKSSPTVRNQWVLAASASFTALTVAAALLFNFAEDPIGAPALSLLVAIMVVVTASRHAKHLSAASRGGAAS